MSANRSQYFFKQLTLSADYKDNDFKLESDMNHLKIIVENGSADCQYVLTGPDSADIDGVVLAGNILTFNDLNFHRISLRGDTADVRVWAWK